MHNELEGPEEQKQAFLADERSAFVSQDLATEQGWKLGVGWCSTAAFSRDSGR